MSSAPPLPPAPGFVEAKVKEPERPPYVAIPSITNPRLAEIPEVDKFLTLCASEKVVKSWRVRVRRPKFPWMMFLASFLPVPFLLAPAMFMVMKAERSRLDYDTMKYEIHRSDEFLKTNEYPGPYGPSPSVTPPYFPEDSKGSNQPPFPEAPPPGFDNPNRDRFDLPPSSFDPPKEVSSPARVPISPVAYFAAPTPVAAMGPWFGLFLFFLLLMVLPLCVLVWFFFFALRGHTFLYLTNRRVIVVELERNLISRHQTVLNYTLENVAGFTLHAQRGLKKFLALILLKEKRTFYMAIVTRTLAQFSLGAVNTWRSQYEPGLDAVNVCAELDALVLGLKAGLAAK